MHGPRALFLAVAATFVAMTATAEAGAPSPPPAPMSVSFKCPSKVAPGRVRCDAEATPGEGRTLAWADVVVLPGSLPPFRGRIAPADGEVRPERASFAFAVLAKDHGPAKVRIALRAVTCGSDGCRAESLEREVAVDVD